MGDEVAAHYQEYGEASKTTICLKEKVETRVWELSYS
jgi:hypothetical protein